MAKKKTFWPYGILLSLIACVAACVATIIIASDYPVYEDDFYFESYQNVENNFNQIQRAQVEFDKNYKLSLNLPSQSAKKKRLIYTLAADEKGINLLLAPLKNTSQKLTPKPTMILTRPHTNKQDLRLDPVILPGQNGELFIRAKVPELERGRWLLKLKLEAGEGLVGFFTYELNLL